METFVGGVGRGTTKRGVVREFTRCATPSASDCDTNGEVGVLDCCCCCCCCDSAVVRRGVKKFIALYLFAPSMLLVRSLALMS